MKPPPEPLPRYRHVEVFLNASLHWNEKDRRRAATLLRFCSKHVGARVAGLLLEEPAWLNQMKVVDDESRLSKAMRTELDRRLKEAGQPSLWMLEDLAEWCELFDRAKSEAERSGLSRVSHRAIYLRPSIARRLRKLALAADTSRMIEIARLWFLLDRPDCVRGTKVVRRSILLSAFGDSQFFVWFAERFPTVRPATAEGAAPAANEPA